MSKNTHDTDMLWTNHLIQFSLCAGVDLKRLHQLINRYGRKVHGCKK